MRVELGHRFRVINKMDQLALIRECRLHLREITYPARQLEASKCREVSLK